MTIKKSTLHNLMLMGAVIIAIIGLVFVLSPGNTPAAAAATATVDASGKQIFELNAKLGYTPTAFTAQANVDGILRVKTNGTIYCSTNIRLPQLNVSQTLPRTGITDIAIAAQPAGTQLNGTCSMGMYHFVSKFV